MASIGAFVGGSESVIKYLRYNVRSQIYAKTLPMPLVLGALKRLELLRTKPELKQQLWVIVNALQKGLREKGFNIGNTQSPVTPLLFKGGVGEAGNAALDIRETYNIFCSVVIYPVVPKDIIMFRLIPTAVHTLDDVAETIDVLGKVKVKLDEGIYKREEFVSITV